MHNVLGGAYTHKAFPNHACFANFKKKGLEGGLARPNLAPLLSINADSLQIIFAMILFFLEMCNLFCNIKSIV